MRGRVFGVVVSFMGGQWFVLPFLLLKWLRKQNEIDRVTTLIRRFDREVDLVKKSRLSGEVFHDFVSSPTSAKKKHSASNTFFPFFSKKQIRQLTVKLKSAANDLDDHLADLTTANNMYFL